MGKKIKPLELYVLLWIPQVQVTSLVILMNTFSALHILQAGNMNMFMQIFQLPLKC